MKCISCGKETEIIADQFEPIEPLCSLCSQTGKKVYTSIEENLQYIDVNPPEFNRESRHLRHSGWTLYRLEKDDEIHYFFCRGKAPENAVPCEKPECFTVSIDKERGIPFLVKKIKKEKKWFK